MGKTMTDRNGLQLGVAGNWLAHIDQLNPRRLTEIIHKDAAMVAGLGYDAIELTIAHCDPFIFDLGDAFWRDTAAALRDLGVEPVSVHGPYYPTMDQPLQPAIDKLIAHAEAACALGVRGLVVHPVYHSHLHVTDIARRALEWDTRISLAISDAIGDTGTMLCIENTPHHSFNYLEKLLSQLPRDNIGLCFDTGHYHVRPEGSLKQTLARFADRIAHVHLSDNDGLSDQHLPPGEGNFNWNAFLAAIDLEALRHTLMIELSPPIRAQVGPDAAAQTRDLFARALRSAKTVLQPTDDNR